MGNYSPNTPFNVVAFLLTPTTKTAKGVETKVFTEDTTPFFCSFRTFGGTEKVVNGILSVENTATIETHYDPRITSGCNVRIGETHYEILGTPENINMRYQYMKFKVRAVEGGA